MLGTTGIYTLLVEGYIYAGSAAQALTVRADLDTAPTQATSLGALVEATIATPGQRQLYTFTVGQPTSVLIDPLGFDGRFNWSLTLLDGTVVSRAFDQSYGTESYYNDHPNPLLLLGAGSYTLSIGASQNATGSASLRIIDTSAAPVITPGIPVSGTLAPVGADTVYRLSGTQGQQFYFAALAQGGGSATWKLVDPGNNLVFDDGFQNQGVVTLPATGTYLLLLLDENNDYSPPLTYTFDVFTDVPANAVPVTPPSQAPAPDLQVQALAVSAPGGVIQSGAPVTLAWVDANTGTLPATGVWTDQVVITNLTTGTIIAQASLATDGTALAAGGTLARTLTLTLPPGGTAVGQLQVSVMTDATNVVAEQDPAGTGEGNNQASVTVTATLAAYPDLVATDVTASPPGSYTPGETVTVTWTTVNQGDADALTGWTEQLIVRDTTTGHQVAEATVVQPAGLAAGGSVQRSATIVWPAGADATGAFSFVVTVDTKNEVFEANAAGTGETNDVTELDVLSAPDLIVNGLALTQAGANLLSNPGFESGYAGWTVNPEATFTADEPAFDGTQYYYAGNTASGFAQQTVPLLSSLAAADIDAGLYDIAFGGWLRSYPQSPADHGAITLSFQDANGAALSSSTVAGTDSTGGWALTTRQVAIPAGARFATYLFTATRQDGTSDDAYLDDAFARVVAHGSSPAQPEAGGQVSIQWSDVNTGTAATPAPWTDLITVTNGDTGATVARLAVPADPGAAGLAAGAVLARQLTFTLPDTRDGSGNLVVSVTANRDVNNDAQITEASADGSAQYNNTSQLGIVSVVSSHADLVASGLSVPATAQGGSTIQVGYTVTNAGPAATDAGSWTDEVVFSKDGIIGNADDVVLGSFVHSGALAPGASYTAQQDVTLPAAFDGTGYIAVLADPAGAVTEPDRGREYVTPPAAIAVTSLYSDLTTEAVSAPGTAHAGDRIAVSWRVRNLGDAATDAPAGWTDRVYLSQSGSVAGAILLGDVPHQAALAVGGSYTASATFALPGAVTGAYHVLVVTDADGGQFQGGRTANDTAEAPGALLIDAQPTPDLAVTAVGIPAATVPGVPTTVTFTVTNQGQAIARGPWTDQLVLLYGAGFASSASLGTVARSFDLAPGASYTVSATVTLPSLPDGPVEVAATTDAGMQVNEGGRTSNNTLDSAAFATTHPDLVPVMVQAPLTIVSGQVLTVTWTTVNQGTGPALPGWTETVTLVQGGTSTVIGTIGQATPLAAGASVARRVDYTLPISVSGAFQIVVTVDAGNTVAETAAGEANNAVAEPLAVALAPYADLAVSNVTAPAITVADPATVTIGWTVGNLGTGAGITSSWTDEIVASPDAVAGDADDIVLGRYAHTGALGVGQSYNGSATITLPPGFNGHYHLFVITNADGNVFEDGATANDAAQPPTFFDVVPYPYADDVVTAVTPAAGATSGQKLALTWTVANQGIGPTDVSEWVDNVYLSTSPTGSNGVLLGSFDHLGYLTVGGSYTRTADVTLPNGIAGTYYLSVVTAGTSTPNYNSAQPGAAITGPGAPYEFIYTGNDTGLSAPTAVALAPAPDLVVNDVTVPSTATEGTAVNVTWTVANAGAGAAGGTWTDNLVLHLIGDPNPGTVVGSYIHQGPLAAGQSYTRTEQITLPLHISGAYEFIVVTDATNAVYEGAGEGNNRLASTTPVVVTVLPRPDLVVTDVTVPATVEAGASLSASFVVTNTGPVSTGATAWTDDVYLSLDGQASDGTLIASLMDGSSLDPQQQYVSTTPTFVIPDRYSGTVYLIVQADANGAVDEYPNTNSTTVTPIYVNPLPLPDLVVSAVTAPSLTFAGNQATVHYTVTNKGPGATDLGNYAEQIWLTTDKQRPNPGKGDVLLQEIEYTGGPLASGAGYDRTVTVTIPTVALSGTYYLTAWVDPYGTLLQTELAPNINPDDPNEIQNDNYKAGNSATGGTEIIAPPAPPAAPLPDVAVTAVSADPVGAATQDFTFSWTVTNNGPGTASDPGAPDPWTDTVYLSTAPTLDAPGALAWNLGSYARVRDLAAGQSYTNTQTVLLNPAARGLYVIVVTRLATDTDAGNNVASAATDVTGGVPDLVVQSVSAAASADSGEQTTITYTVKNTSSTPIWSGTQYWADDVYLSPDSTFIAGRATLLGTVEHANTGVTAGGSYTDSLTATLPAGIGGNYYVYVFVNQTGRHAPVVPDTSGDNAGDLAFYATAAYDDPAGDSGQGVLPVIYKEAELQVSNFTVPATAAAGSTVTATYTVTNIGNRATRVAAWTDKIFLSLDASLDNSDDLLTLEQAGGQFVSAENDHRGVLAAGASYTATITFTLPFEVGGPFNLIVEADSGYGASGFSASSISPRLQGLGGSATGQVQQFGNVGHNVAAQAVTVTPTMLPDLTVTSVSAPQRAVIGGTFTVGYTVTDGGGSTPDLQGDWNDLVYLSVDPNLDLQADRYIGSYRHTGGLAAGASYSNTLTFNVPTNLPGDSYYVFVVTDPAVTNATGEVFETDETNNATASAVPMIIDTPPPTDLQVDSVSVPGSATAGQPIHIAWTDSDHASVPVSGNWTDSVYLSTDGVWSIDDVLLGRVSTGGTLNQGDAVNLSLDTTLPGVSPGNYHVIVRTNIYDTVYEGAFEANDTTASAGTIAVTVPALTIGAPLATTLLPGQQLLYQVDVPEGQTLRVTLAADNDLSVNTLYIRYGQAPTTSAFDATSAGGLAANLTALIPSTRPGTYYVLVQGYSGPSAGTGVTLLAEELPLVITNVATDVGGTGQYVTTTITGAQFSPEATLKLVDPDIDEVSPVSYQVVNSTEIIATFDLTSAPHAQYDVQVTNPDGSQAIIPYRFLVERTVEPDVTVGIGGSRTILAGDSATYSVALDNLGNLDAPYTLFQFGVPNLGNNPIVYGLPYLTFSDNVAGAPLDVAAAPTPTCRTAS